jgi:hypothetical protein
MWAQCRQGLAARTRAETSQQMMAWHGGSRTIDPGEGPMSSEEQTDLDALECPSQEFVPPSLDHVTTTWLTRVLRESGAITQAQVVAFRTAAVPWPSYVSECGRIHLEYDRDDVAAPTSIFAKFGAYNSDALRRLTPASHAEVRFYKNFAPELGDLVPKCFFARVHPDGLHFALLLEDLAPSRLMLLEPDVARLPGSIETSLRGIAKIHALFWNRQRSGGDIKGLYCPFLDADSAAAWLAYVRAQVIRRHGAAVPQLLLDIVDLVVKDIRPIYATCARQPLTLVHSDYHAAQVFLPTQEGGRFCIVDWFGVRYAEPASSVQRMLLITLGDEVRHHLENQLLRSYCDALQNCGVNDYGFDTLLDRYRASMIDSVSHQLGTAAFADLDRVDQQLENFGVDWRDVCFTRLATACADHDVLRILRRDAQLGRRELERA